MVHQTTRLSRTPFVFHAATIKKSSYLPEHGSVLVNFFVSLKFKFTLVIALNTNNRLHFEVLFYTPHAQFQTYKTWWLLVYIKWHTLDYIRLFVIRKRFAIVVHNLVQISLFFMAHSVFCISMVTCPTCLSNIFVENELSTEIGTQACRLSACIK